MKKFLLAILTAIMCLFCLAGCGTTGKYSAVSYEIAGFTKEVTDSENYIELKSDDVAVVNLSLGTITWSGEGTWEKGEDGKVFIKVGGLEKSATVDGGVLTLDFGVGSVKLEK